MIRKPDVVQCPLTGSGASPSGERRWSPPVRFRCLLIALSASAIGAAVTLEAIGAGVVARSRIDPSEIDSKDSGEGLVGAAGSTAGSRPCRTYRVSHRKGQKPRREPVGSRPSPS